MRETKDLFGDHSYTWSSGGGALNSSGVTINPSMIGGSVYLKGVDSAGDNTVTVTAQIRMNTDGNTEQWGKSFDLLDAATGVNTFTASTTGGEFQANLYEQDWWMPGHSVRVNLARGTDREITVTNYVVLEGGER